MKALKAQLSRFASVDPAIAHANGAITQTKEAIHITPAVLEVNVNRRVTLRKAIIAARALGLNLTKVPDDGNRVHADIDTASGGWGVIVYDAHRPKLKTRRFVVYSSEIEENPRSELTSDQRRKIVDFFGAVAGKN